MKLSGLTYRQLRTFVTGIAAWDEYRTANGITRASDLSKAQLFEIATQVFGFDPETDVAADATDATDAPEMDDTPAPVAPPAPAPVVKADPLASLRPVLSPEILKGADTAIAAIVADLENARRERDAAKAAAVVPFQPLAPGQKPSGAATGETITFNAAFGSRKAEFAGQTLALWAGCADTIPVDPDYVWPEFTPLAAWALEQGENVFLYGPRGTGKTSWGEQYAAATGRPYFAIVCHKEKAFADFFGFPAPSADGGMDWFPGELLIAMQTPGAVISIEEIGALRPELSTGPFQSLLQKPQHGARRVLLGDGRVAHCAPGVVFIATNNDAGTEPTPGSYVGLSMLNAALRSRFAVFAEVDYLPSARESVALRRRTGAPAPLCDEIVKFANLTRREVRTGDMVEAVSTRHMMAFARMVMAFPGMADAAYKVTIFESFGHDDQVRLDALAKAHLDFKALGAMARGEAIAQPQPEGETRHGFTATA